MNTIHNTTTSPCIFKADDLCLEDFSAIVPILERIEGLQYLYLRGNQITEVPNLSFLKSLKLLDLSDNPPIQDIQSLIASLSNLSELRYLSLNLKSDEDEDAVVVGLPELKLLNGMELDKDISYEDIVYIKDKQRGRPPEEILRIIELNDGKLLEDVERQTINNVGQALCALQIIKEDAASLGGRIVEVFGNLDSLSETLGKYESSAELNTINPDDNRRCAAVLIDAAVHAIRCDVTQQIAVPALELALSFANSQCYTEGGEDGCGNRDGAVNANNDIYALQIENERLKIKLERAEQTRPVGRLGTGEQPVYGTKPMGQSATASTLTYSGLQLPPCVTRPAKVSESSNLMPQNNLVATIREIFDSKLRTTSLRGDEHLPMDMYMQMYLQTKFGVMRVVTKQGSAILKSTSAYDGQLSAGDFSVHPFIHFFNLTLNDKIDEGYYTQLNNLYSASDNVMKAALLKVRVQCPSREFVRGVEASMIEGDYNDAVRNGVVPSIYKEMIFSIFAEDAAEILITKISKITKSAKRVPFRDLTHMICMFAIERRGLMLEPLASQFNIVSKSRMLCQPEAYDLVSRLGASPAVARKVVDSAFGKTRSKISFSGLVKGISDQAADLIFMASGSGISSGGVRNNIFELKEIAETECL